MPIAPRPDPFLSADDEARDMARRLVAGATYAAIAVLEPDTGLPFCSRIGLGTDAQGLPLALVSMLAHHTRALQANPACCLLIGEPGPKGDPLTHPRLTLNGRAEILPNACPAHEEMAAQYLRRHPKAKLYIGFADFHFVRFQIDEAFLNGGFGKAYVLTPADLGLSA